MGNFLKPNPGIACVCDSKNNLWGRIYFKDGSILEVFPKTKENQQRTKAVSSDSIVSPYRRKF